MENEIDQIHITFRDRGTESGRDMDGNGSCIGGGVGDVKKDDVDGLVPPPRLGAWAGLACLLGGSNSSTTCY